MHRGEWVNFLPQQDDDPAWNVRGGTYRVLNDGGVEASSGKQGHMIVCRARAGAAFEVKGEFEVVRSSTGDFQAGLVMGMPEMSNADWLAFRMKRNKTEGQVASYSRGWTRQQAHGEAKLDEQRSTFEFRFEDGRIRSNVNGEPTHRDARQPAKVRYADEEFLIGLGAFNDMNDTVLCYRNVQLRSIQSTNAPGRN